MGVGRRTREEIAKWNQMTAPRFQTGETSDIPGFPYRKEREVRKKTRATKEQCKNIETGMM